MARDRQASWGAPDGAPLRPRPAGAFGGPPESVVGGHPRGSFQATQQQQQHLHQQQQQQLQQQYLQHQPYAQPQYYGQQQQQIYMQQELTMQQQHQDNEIEQLQQQCRSSLVASLRIVGETNEASQNTAKQLAAQSGKP